ncbi:uncharacterized protein L969DRAFT_16591 [Mixia osmundae IAM 14324]|uniref:uncharacterized protein n=1 Tax=Mixia osmundae (strain CBS 9802 / IAM 14324 / JCM 22182 / KY 12970) TaxID=764103 RepID=UPI0004A55879|nr:uncharacterized protein L969DRAFT_16591 [Mixia osmundae IAM 14324]KEI39919.1 hypothetical protein L969DRAFT_16591 [Mixia osmundae IAM 14324]
MHSRKELTILGSPSSGQSSPASLHSRSPLVSPTRASFTTLGSAAAPTAAVTSPSPLSPTMATQIDQPPGRSSPTVASAAMPSQSASASDSSLHLPHHPPELPGASSRLADVYGSPHDSPRYSHSVGQLPLPSGLSPHNSYTGSHPSLHNVGGMMGKTASPLLAQAILHRSQESQSPMPAHRTHSEDTRTQLFVGNLPFRVRWQDLKDLFRKCGTVLRADVALTVDNRSKGFGSVLFANEADALMAIDVFNGFNWQMRVLDDPTGALMLAAAAAQPHTGQALGPQPTPLVWPSGQPGSVSRQPSQSFLRPNGVMPNQMGMAMPVNNGYGQPMMLQHDGTHMPLAMMHHPHHPYNLQAHSSPYLPDRSASPANYGQRHLFVGNLPFNCQWQDLKDLFRAAGNILRADVQLGPDGRSRGFGSVLFAYPEEAQNAMHMFNGYEFNGRQLKVHFDRFVHNANSPAPGYGAVPNYMQHPLAGYPMQRPQHYSQPMQNYLNNEDDMIYTPGDMEEASHNLIPLHLLSPDPEMGPQNGMMSMSAGYFPDASPQPQGVAAHPQTSRRNDETQSHAANDETTQGDSASPADTQSEAVQSPALAAGSNDSATSAVPSPGSASQEPHHRKPPPSLRPLELPPQGIAMPMGFGPMSPHFMTPSMPSFSFHPFSPTPPLMPQYLSPGIGPYSPAMTYFQHPGADGYVALTPGAPLHHSRPDGLPPSQQYQQSVPVLQEDSREIGSNDGHGSGSRLQLPSSDPEASYFPTAPMSNLLSRRASSQSARRKEETLVPAAATTRSASQSLHAKDASDDLSQDLGNLVIAQDEPITPPAIAANDGEVVNSATKRSFFGLPSLPRRNNGAESPRVEVERRGSIGSSALPEGRSPTASRTKKMFKSIWPANQPTSTE